jgi:DNA gyrase subunit B
VDNGRGIPVEMHEKEKRSALEVVMTVLHAGGNLTRIPIRFQGVFMVWVSCVNALSSRMTVEVMRQGRRWSQTYEKRKPLAPVAPIGDSDESGTITTFMPDSTIFQTIEFKFDILAARLRELAFLNKNILLTLTDRRETAENGNSEEQPMLSSSSFRSVA